MTLKERRLQIGLTQVDVSQELDVDQSALSNWERGKSTPLRKMHKKLASVYQCSVGDIVRSIEETKASTQE